MNYSLCCYFPSIGIDETDHKDSFTDKDMALINFDE